MKTSLGIWALGPMVTRFNPGWEPPDLAGARRRRSATGSRGPRRPDGRLRVPLPRRDLARQPRRRARARSTATASTIASGLHLDSRFAQRRAALARPGDRAEALRLTREATDLAGQIGAHMISWPDRGLQLPVPDPVRGLVEVARRGRGRGGARDCGVSRRQALPRAQELRAGDEDLHAEHRDDAARDPQVRAQGITTCR